MSVWEPADVVEITFIKARGILYYCDIFSRTRGMALVSLSNVLHHTGYSKDASVVVQASLNVLKDKRISFFTLGNIFAVSICETRFCIHLGLLDRAQNLERCRLF